MLILFSFHFKSFEIATLRDLFIFLFPLYPLLFTCSEILTRRLYFEHTLSKIILKQCFERSDHVWSCFISNLTLLMIRTDLTPYFLNVFWTKLIWSFWRFSTCLWTHEKFWLNITKINTTIEINFENIERSHNLSDILQIWKLWVTYAWKHLLCEICVSYDILVDFQSIWIFI